MSEGEAAESPDATRTPLDSDGEPGSVALATTDDSTTCGRGDR